MYVYVYVHVHVYVHVYVYVYLTPNTDQVLLKSDYWKKFEGTVMKQGRVRLVSTNPKH